GSRRGSQEAAARRPPNLGTLGNHLGSPNGRPLAQTPLWQRPPTHTHTLPHPPSLPAQQHGSARLCCHLAPAALPQPSLPAPFLAGAREFPSQLTAWSPAAGGLPPPSPRGLSSLTALGTGGQGAVPELPTHLPYTRAPQRQPDPRPSPSPGSFLPRGRAGWLGSDRRVSWVLLRAQSGAELPRGPRSPQPPPPFQSSGSSTNLPRK
uniref:Uncharacterized protein n=1 Tax=Chelydra serpentina TaxID=8475 RepID=A0A8C3XRF4_CHESE